MEWIAADISGLLGWHRPMNQLMRYDNQGELCGQAEIQGIPISSNLPLDEFWVQDKGCLKRRRWTAADLGTQPSGPPDTKTLMVRTAAAYLAQFDVGKAQQEIAGWISVVDEGVAVANDVIVLGESNLDLKLLQSMIDRVHALPVERSRAILGLRQALHPWCVWRLLYHLAGIDAVECSSQITNARLEAFVSPIHHKLTRGQELLSEVNSRRTGLSKAIADDPIYTESWKRCATNAEVNLQRILQWA
jgi:hypothetical protein